MPKIFRLVFDSAKSFEKDDGYAMASHIALSGLTAIFPFLIFVTSLAGFLGAQPLADKAASAFFEIWPPRVSGPIVQQIHSVLSNRHGGLLTISAALAAYFSSSGVEALRTGLNRAYGARGDAPMVAAATAIRRLCLPWRPGSSICHISPGAWAVGLASRPQ